MTLRRWSVWGLLFFAMLAGEFAALRYYGVPLVSRIAPSSFTMPGDLACFRTNAALALGYHLSPAAIGATSCAFMYPPPFFLLTAPLAWASAGWGFALWTLFGVALLTFAGRAAQFSWRAIALGLISPPSLYCLQAGQTGEIMSALLLLSLALAETNPLLAGIAAGCVIVKPQFALLLPVCFLAARKWPAIIAAGLTVAVICLLATAIFGIEAWRHFATVGIPAAHVKLNWPWPEPSQGIMLSVFMMLRSLGAGLKLAYAVQSAATLCAIAAAWYLWRPKADIALPMRVLLTLCLMPLATPYGYIYDIPGIALALAAAFVSAPQRFFAPLALLWFITGMYILISMVSFVTGGLFLALLVVLLWSRVVGQAAAVAA